MQALLEVAVCIAQPFTAAGHDAHSPGRIPTEKLLGRVQAKGVLYVAFSQTRTTVKPVLLLALRLLRNLEKDLRDIEFMSSNLPWPFSCHSAYDPVRGDG